MQVNRRRGLRVLLSGTVLGFVVMLGLLALTTFLLFTVRSDLDLAVLDDREAAAEINRQESARRALEANLALLQQTQAALQTQVEEAKVARGVAEEAVQRETIMRTAAEQESARQEQAKLEAQKAAAAERQLREDAEMALEEEKEAVTAANQVATSERLAKQSLQHRLNRTQEQAQVDVAREQANAQLLLLGIANGSLTYRTEPLPDYAAEGVAEAVDETTMALNEWNAQEFSVSMAGDGQEADLTIGWIKDAGGHSDTPVGRSSRIEVPLGATNCLGNWAPYDGETMRRLLWHEIGHALGYANSDDENNVMYDDLETRFAVGHTVELIVAPGANAIHTIPLCGEGTFTYEFEAPPTGNSYQISVLRPDVAPADYFDPASMYPGCSSALELYTNQCTVADGAKLLLYSQTAILRVTGTITRDAELPEIDMEWDPAAFQYNDAALEAFGELFS